MSATPCFFGQSAVLPRRALHGAGGARHWLAACCLVLPGFAADPEPLRHELWHDEGGAVELPADPAGIYQMSCVTCHGEDGTGAAARQLGFELPLPDFSDCNFASREGNTDWSHVAARGGPARAFSRMMPAMGDALTDGEIDLALQHIRTFCDDPAWPRGELNLPRPLNTTKAYPEDEVVIDATWDSTDGGESFMTNFFYEQRIGARSQFELIVPFSWRETSDGDWASGLGDVGLGFKSALFHDLEAGYIVSPGIELLLPTGDEDRGFGSGTPVIEPYLSYGQLLGREWFAQAQIGAALPIDGSGTREEVFGRMAVGRSFYQECYGRRWTPQLELLYSDELGDGREGFWDLVPQLQVTLSTRQHLRLGFGTAIPLNRRKDRDMKFTIYLLWDWFDGGFFEGW